MSASTTTIKNMETRECTYKITSKNKSMHKEHCGTAHNKIATYGGVRHFMLVDLMMWFKNSFSSWITVLIATYTKYKMLAEQNT